MSVPHIRGLQVLELGNADLNDSSAWDPSKASTGYTPLPEYPKPEDLPATPRHTPTFEELLARQRRTVLEASTSTGTAMARKERDRQQIAQDTEAFLRSGGQIQRLGATGSSDGIDG